MKELILKDDVPLDALMPAPLGWPEGDVVCAICGKPANGFVILLPKLALGSYVCGEECVKDNWGDRGMQEAM